MHNSKAVNPFQHAKIIIYYVLLCWMSWPAYYLINEILVKFQHKTFQSISIVYYSIPMILYTAKPFINILSVIKMLSELHFRTFNTLKIIIFLLFLILFPVVPWFARFNSFFVCFIVRQNIDLNLLIKRKVHSLF